ncbi:MAG: hypothetical protein ABL959_21970 [Pyrinomonadaceae bacterium]
MTNEESIKKIPLPPQAGGQMKKGLSILFLAATIAYSGIGAFGQTYTQPREVPIDRLVRQTFPQFYDRSNSYPALIPESFFPIGWSKDGKFAYYSEPVDEACGCYYAYLAIQDLRTDKVIWEFKYDQGDDTDPKTGKILGSGNMDELWKKNKKLFSEKLAENGIVASRVVMHNKTFSTAGTSYTAKSTKKMGQNADGGEERVDLYTVSLRSTKLGTKTVFTSEDHTKDDYWFMLDAGLIGAIKSPYENRVALIAIEAMKGYEGPPHTAQIRVVGSDLTSGFSKK